MSKSITNVAASVHQRLLNITKATRRPYGDLLQYYAMERFLYRLTRSDYADRFILKGALMFWVWRVADSRATMDIDMLGKMKNDLSVVTATIKSICTQAVKEDGLRFDPSTVKAARIVEGAEYKGVRVRFRGFLERARITMQIDIGFGDTVSPGPVSVDYPSLLDFPVPHMKGYRRETSIAEKFEAMCTKGLLNSRMKDFYDIWLLCRRFDFEGKDLAGAIRGTFGSRHLEIPAAPLALEPLFARDKDKVVQWRAFRRKSHLPGAPANLHTVIAVIKRFLGPVAKALAEGKPFNGKWKAPGPWRRTRK